MLGRDRSSSNGHSVMLASLVLALSNVLGACSRGTGGPNVGGGASCDGNLVCDPETETCQAVSEGSGGCSGVIPGGAICGSTGATAQYTCAPGAAPPAEMFQECELVATASSGTTTFCCVSGGGYCEEIEGEECEPSMGSYICLDSARPTDTAPSLSCTLTSTSIGGATFCCLSLDSGVADDGPAE
jgi:hypothetical protein